MEINSQIPSLKIDDIHDASCKSWGSRGVSTGLRSLVKLPRDLALRSSPMMIRGGTDPSTGIDSGVDGLLGWFGMESVEGIGVINLSLSWEGPSGGCGVEVGASTEWIELVPEVLSPKMDKIALSFKSTGDTGGCKSDWI